MIQVFNQKYLDETKKIYLPLAEQTHFTLHKVMSWACNTLEMKVRLEM